jgi:hypothetical protein
MRRNTFVKAIHRWATALTLLITTAFTNASAQSAAQEIRPEWARTLEEISRGVVATQFDSARSFDTDTNASLQATGFLIATIRQSLS